MKYYSDEEYVTRRKRTRMINEDEELRIFKMLRKTTDRLGMTLGVCMSRPSVQELATAPCEGGVYIGKVWYTRNVLPLKACSKSPLDF